MHFEPDEIYHVYNRGNNKAIIFFSEENYCYLLRKVKAEWLPYCDLLSYCLMPNHFHFMLQPNKAGCQTLLLKGQPSHLQVLSKAIGKTLSSYTQAINGKHRTTGNLFQKKTKAKCLTDTSTYINGYNKSDYLFHCFNYIHYNPVAAGLVKDICHWTYSSWPDYFSARGGNLCSIEKARREIGENLILNQSYAWQPPDEKIIDGIW
jgi:putative transposase